jgi:hypothetical protein
MVMTNNAGEYTGQIRIHRETNLRYLILDKVTEQERRDGLTVYCAYRNLKKSMPLYYAMNITDRYTVLALSEAAIEMLEPLT